MVAIKKQIVTDLSKTYGIGNKCDYIVVHQTGNENEGADAQAHANLQSNGNVRSASWHISVDDKQAIQSFEYNVRCWHAGDGRGEGNYNGIAIELCINKDGDYNKALANGADVVRQLMKQFNLPIGRVKQHNHFSGKNCPAQIRAGKNGVNWQKFLDMVQEKPLPVLNTSKATDTNSIVDYLKSIGVDSSYANREKLAKQYGITGYRGTPLQNVTLLDKIRGGAKPVHPKPKPQKKYTKALGSGSIVDFLKANGVSSTLANRKKIASANGIKGYKGTEEQNIKLLAILKKQ